jgi:hypothetical protein
VHRVPLGNDAHQKLNNEDNRYDDEYVLHGVSKAIVIDDAGSGVVGLADDNHDDEQ